MIKTNPETIANNIITNRAYHAARRKEEAAQHNLTPIQAQDAPYGALVMDVPGGDRFLVCRAVQGIRLEPLCGPDVFVNPEDIVFIEPHVLREFSQF